MFTARLSVSVVILSLLATPGLAAPAGKAVGLSPVARIISGSQQGDLAVGQDVFMGDKIATGATGNVQIEFGDQTRLVIGPGSELEISKYVTSGSAGADAFSVNALAGAFRFISGISAKPNYQISTPTATIGIRGTRFDFGVRPAGRTYIMLYDGVARLCGSAGSCRDLSDLCAIAATNSSGDAMLAQESNFLPRRNDIRLSFPYVRSQGALNQDFRIAAARSCRDAVSSPAGNDAGGAGNGEGDSGGNRG